MNLILANGGAGQDVPSWPGQVLPTALKQEVVGPDLSFASRHNAGPFNNVSEFANVSWPAVLLQELSRFRAQVHLVGAKLGQEASRQ